MEKKGNTYILTDEEFQSKKQDFSGAFTTIIKKKDGVYYYKLLMLDEAVNEVICEKLGTLLGLKMNHYFFAVHNGIYSVMSKDFKKADAKYIEGYKIIIDYAKTHGQLKDDYFTIKNANNLENIWNALDYRYKDYPNRKETVANIMKQICQLFMFDVLTCQIDRHSSNWTVEETKEKIALSPIYDNHYAFNLQPYQGIKVDDPQADTTVLKELEKFIDVSSCEFVEEFKRIVESIPPQVLSNIIDDIERDIGEEIVNKPDLISIYKNRYELVYNSLFNRKNIERA